MLRTESGDSVRLAGLLADGVSGAVFGRFLRADVAEATAMEVSLGDRTPNLRFDRIR